MFFIIAGHMPGQWRGEGERLHAGPGLTAQSGLALFSGTQLAGIVMDGFKVGDQFQWQKVDGPAVIMLACRPLVLFYKGTVPRSDRTDCFEQAAWVRPLAVSQGRVSNGELVNR